MLDAVESASNAVNINQVLDDGHGVTGRLKLCLNIVAVVLAQSICCGGRSLWLGWGNLSG